jgi:hypothetical protein
VQHIMLFIICEIETKVDKHETMQTLVMCISRCVHRFTRFNLLIITWTCRTKSFDKLLLFLHIHKHAVMRAVDIRAYGCAERNVTCYHFVCFMIARDVHAYIYLIYAYLVNKYSHILVSHALIWRAILVDFPLFSVVL